MAENDAGARVWTRQFDAALDFPERAAEIRLAICGTPRCGSHFLGHTLYRAGLFGYPLEYMNPRNLPFWIERAKTEGGDPSRVITYLERRRTSPNGLFSIKLFIDHLGNFRDHGGDLRNFRAVLLHRSDVVAQAVSFEWAIQSGSWISEMPERVKPRYDATAIARRLMEIVEADGQWRLALGVLGEPILHMRYEDILLDPAAAAARVADHCGVTLADATPVAGFTPERQESDDKREWIARFRRDIVPEGLDVTAGLARCAELAKRPRRRSLLRRVAARLSRTLQL